tara:strand:+ start:2127 stop:2486 length:360 start_codon:yes stop_codon:yes gene_type:complete
MRVKITKERMLEIIQEEVKLAEITMPVHEPVNITSPHEPEDRSYERLEDEQERVMLDKLKEMWLNWSDDDHPYYHELKEFIEQYEPVEHEGQECEEAHPYETHESWVDASMEGKREMES